MAGHRHQRPIRQHELGVAAELLDEAEDVVPPPAVESHDVVAQFVEDLVHLEGGQDGLDQHGGLDRADGEPQLLLRHHEDVVPEPGFEVILELGQVEVGSGSLIQQGPGVVEEVERKIEERPGNRLAVDLDVLLAQVPTAGTDKQRRGMLVQTILLAVGTVVGDRAPDRLANVELALDRGVEGGRVRVLEIGHEDLGAGVQRVDDHLAVDRPGDLDPPVQEVRRDRRHPPVPLANGLGLAQEIGQPAGIEFFLHALAAGQKLLPPPLEGPVQLGH